MKEFDVAYMETEFRRLAGKLEQPICIHAIGGGAMAWRGQKTGTKDIDVILESDSDEKTLVKALKALNYATPQPIEGPYRRMGARGVLENEDGFRWDIFVTHVKGFEFSDRMRARSEKWLAKGPLEVKAVSSEDIFAFKALTDRERDREDMNAIFTHGLDPSIIHEEVVAQARRPTGPRFAAFFFEGISEFVEKYGILYPRLEELEELAGREVITTLLINRLPEGPIHLGDFARRIDTDLHLVREAAKWVVQHAEAELDGETLHPR